MTDTNTTQGVSTAASPTTSSALLPQLKTRNSSDATGVVFKPQSAQQRATAPDSTDNTAEKLDANPALGADTGNENLESGTSLNAGSPKTPKTLDALSPLSADSTPSASPSAASQAKKEHKKFIKREIKKMTNSTIAEVMAALSTDKGAEILQLSALVNFAKKRKKNKDNDKSRFPLFMNIKLKRQDAANSLGLTFHTPGRIQSKDIEWQMDQYLVITKVFERDGVKHSLRNGDIVVAVDGTEVSTIQDLQVVVANKKKLKLSVVRTTDGVTAASPEDIAQATSELHDKIQSSVKSKVKKKVKAFYNKSNKMTPLPLE